MKQTIVAAVITILMLSPVHTKPHNPKDPRNNPDCVPVGVTTHPSGAVFAEEECNGQRYPTRMDK